eukprot:6945895-Prymnesium_polylepis.2
MITAHSFGADAMGRWVGSAAHGGSGARTADGRFAAPQLTTSASCGVVQLTDYQRRLLAILEREPSGPVGAAARDLSLIHI